MITHWKPEHLTRKAKIDWLLWKLRDDLKKWKYELRVNKGHNLKVFADDPERVAWFRRAIAWQTARVAKIQRLLPQIEALQPAEDAAAAAPRPVLRLVVLH